MTTPLYKTPDADLVRSDEHQGRVIDHDAAAPMEEKKKDGYF